MKIGLPPGGEVFTQLATSESETHYFVEIDHFDRVARVHACANDEYSETTFNTEIGIADIRRQLVIALRECDPAASDALIVPWLSNPQTGWPCPEWAAEQGHKLDALLYAAAQHSAVKAVKSYLNAGADPLCPTYLGDCAARIGIANGMIAQFDRPEWMNRRNARSGETGLFALARDRRCISDLKHAYAMGADPYLKNNDGKTALDLLQRGLDREVLEVIARAEANSLERETGLTRPENRAAEVRRRL